MNKSKKKIISCILSLVLLFSLSTPVITHASDSNCNDVNGNEKYGEREEVTILSSERSSVVVTPTGLPAGGIRFPTGGGIYVNGTGGSNLTLSLGLSYGGISITVDSGIAGTSPNIGGILLTAPNTTDHFIAKIRKTYTVYHKKIDRYQYNTLIGTSYVYDPVLYSVEPYLVKV